MMRALVASMLVVLAAPADARSWSAEARLGHTVRLGQIRVIPVAVIEDSRCPQLVTCVWAGRLRVAATVAGQGRLVLDNGVPLALRRGRLTLVDAVPLARRGEKVPPGDYRFRLRYER